MEDSKKKSFIRVAHILNLWMRSTYGFPGKDHNERKNMYSTEVDYLLIQYARPAITAFSAQIHNRKEGTNFEIRPRIQ